MRQQGEGSIYPRKDGRWVATITINGQRYQRYAKTKSEAHKKLSAIRLQNATGTLVKPDSTTVGDWLDRWLDDNQIHWRPATYSDYADIVRLHLRPAFGKTKLQKLTAIEIQHFYTKCLRKGLSKRRVEMIHIRLKTALKQAVRLGLLASNPADKVNAPRPDKSKVKPWTVEQAQTFLASLEESTLSYDILWLLLLYSGCRLGEILGLRWTDIDFERNTIAIERTRGKVRGEWIEGPPKTASGERTVSLSADVMAKLKAHRAKQFGARLQAGADWPGGEYCVTTRRGATPLPSNLRRAFRSACEVAGVPVIRVHDLRHCHATFTLAAGVDVATVSARLGHSNPTITLRVYAHVLQKAASLVPEQLDGYLRRTVS